MKNDIFDAGNLFHTSKTSKLHLLYMLFVAGLYNAKVVFCQSRELLFSRMNKTKSVIM